METIDSGDFIQEPIDHSADLELEELERVQFLRNNSIDSLEAFLDRLYTDRSIAKSTASSIRTISIGLESMDQHFANYPVQSYTEVASSTNYDVTVESLIGALSSATAKAFDASFAVIKKINDDLDKVYRENDTKFDRIVKQIPEMVKLLSRRPPSPTDRFSPALEKVIKDLTPMAKWFIAPSLDDELTRRYGSPSYFIKKLAMVETSVMDSANRYLTDGEERARTPQRFHELNALIGTRPDSIAFFNSTNEIGRSKTFGESFHSRVKTVRGDFSKRIDSAVDHMSTFEVLHEAIKWLSVTDFTSVRLRDAKKYQTFHENVTKLRETIVPIVRSGMLKSGEPRIGNDYLNDIREMSHGVLEFELWLTEYRQAVSQVAKLLYVYGKTR